MKAPINSRFGRRVVALFVLSAVVPLVLASVLLTRRFNAQHELDQAREMDLAIRAYGTSVMSRLNEADDLLDTLKATASLDDDHLASVVASVPWVKSVHRTSVEPYGAFDASLPQPDADQKAVLERDDTAIVVDSRTSSPRVYIVRPLHQQRLYIELDPRWLWLDVEDYSPMWAVTVNEDAPGRHALFQWHSSETPASALSPDLPVRSWDMYLRARYGAASWRMQAPLLPSPGFALLARDRIAFPAILAGTVVLVSLLAIRLIRRQLKPLDRLSGATRRIAQRNFTEPLDETGDDEFSDMARSFNSMAGSLKLQFSALESIAQIDRLLLRTPELEQILDTLLPQMSTLLGARSIAVVLVDADARANARAFDYYGAASGRMPVRRVMIDTEGLRRAGEQPTPLEFAAGASPPAFLAPHAEAGARLFRIFSLRHDSKFSGFLCLGFTDESSLSNGLGLDAHDFADRLSMILANLERLEQLYLQAHFDPLTRLPNRRLFNDRVSIAIAQAKSGATQGALLYIDLDHFKRVNDTAGHPAGDDLLRVVAERIGASVKEGDSVARLSGDEFAVLLPQIRDADAARQVADRILVSLREPVAIGDRQHHIGASIGIALLPDDGDTVDELLKVSDIAMYRAKEAGKGCAIFFETDMQERMQARLSLETGLHRALVEHQFQLAYQPIVGCGARGTLAAEALVRWPTGPDGKMRSPAEFIPVAEESGLIVDLGSWILSTACEQFARWRDEHLELDYISVNASARQLREASFLADVLAALRKHGMEPRQLQIEITESVLAAGQSIEFTLRQLAELGVRLALDDFGTGYSSLSYLRVFPIHSVKIDRSFVSGIPEDLASCRLAESIIAMCSVLGKEVVAEGVETAIQLQFLEAAGCQSVQGYFLGRPMMAEDLKGFARRLRSRSALPMPADSRAAAGA